MGYSGCLQTTDNPSTTPLWNFIYPWIPCDLTQIIVGHHCESREHYMCIRNTFCYKLNIFWFFAATVDNRKVSQLEKLCSKLCRVKLNLRFTNQSLVLSWFRTTVLGLVNDQFFWGNLTWTTTTTTSRSTDFEILKLTMLNCSAVMATREFWKVNRVSEETDERLKNLKALTHTLSKRERETRTFKPLFKP